MNQMFVTAMASILPIGKTIDAFDRALYDGVKITGKLAEDSTDETLLNELQESLAGDPINLKNEKIGDSSKQALVIISQQPIVALNQNIDTYQCASLGEALAQAKSLLLGNILQVSICCVDSASFGAEQDGSELSGFAQDADYAFSEEHKLTQGAFGFSLRMETNNLYHYACLESNAGKLLDEANTIAEVIDQALNDAHLTVEDIEYLDLSAYRQEQDRREEFTALSAKYCRGDNKLQFSAGSVATCLDYRSSLYDIAAFIKACLAVYHRYIPGVSHWSQPYDVSIWQDSNFYVSEKSKTWFVKDEFTRRVAALSLLNVVDEGPSFYNHILVSDKNVGLARSNKYLAYSCPHCVPFAGDDEKEIKAEILRFASDLDASDGDKSIRRLAKACYQKIVDAEDSIEIKRYRLVIIGEDKATLLSEIALLEKGIGKAISDSTETHWEYKTPKGSYFTAKALGESGKVSFIFPGLGSSYVGLGQNIFHLFPSIFTESFRFTHNVGEELKEETLYPRQQKALGFKDKRQMDIDMVLDLKELGATDTTYSCICSHIITDVFHVRPDMAFGYSMGEANMMTALEVWKEPTKLEARFKENEIFKSRLYGELKTVKALWDIDNNIPGEQLWTTLTLKASKQQVEKVIESEKLQRVYLALINTDDNVVICGEPAACLALVEKLECRAIPMGFVPAIHSPPTYEEYEGIAELYTLETTEDCSIKLYSSSCYLPVPKRSKAIAYSVSKCFCEPVDFPRLVDQVYDDGARIFIEAGAGRTCSTWIDKILKGKEHVIVPLNAKGTEDHLTFTRVLAKLFCHKVNVNLFPLYENVA